MIIISLVGIKNPIIDGIPEAVQKCREAGVTVRIFTEDSKSTSIAVAKQAGILSRTGYPLKEYTQ